MRRPGWRLPSATAACAVLACLLGACTGSAGAPCEAPPGCAGRGPCCDERAACEQTVCQGLTWICEPAAGVFRWQQGTTSAACPAPQPPDLGRDGGARDHAGDHAADLPRDRAADLPRDLAPDGQGRTCSDGDVSFEVDPGLAPCTRPTIVARSATPYPWIGCGVRAASGAVSWDTGPKIEHEGNTVKWTFAPQVPCEAGPFTLHFMKDATDGNVALGTIVATCTP